MTRTWCAYVRVSRVNGRAGADFHSPDQQVEEIRRHARGDLGPVFQDLDVSGGTFVRDGLNAALEWVREDPAGRGIAAYDYSRIGRDTREFLRLVDELEAIGAQVLSALERIDTSTPEGRLMLTQFAAQNEYYRRNVGRRWRSVQARRLEAGLPAGGPVRFGYRRVEGSQVVEPDPVTGPALRAAYLGYTSGTGYQLLVKRLNDAGLVTGRGNAWSTHSLRRTLDSGFGAGKIVLNEGGEFIEGAHDGVISEDEWQEYLRSRARRTAVPRKVATPKWFLSGIARCGRCGGSVYVSSYNNPASTIVCATYRNTRTCPGGASMNRHDLERIVAMWVGGHVAQVSAHVDTGRRDDERRRVRADLDGMTDRRVALDAQLGRLARGYATELLDDVGYASARREVEAEVTVLDEQIAHLHHVLDTLQPVSEDAFTRLIEHTDGTDSGAWNGLLRRVLQRVEIHPKHVVIVPVAGDEQTVPKPTSGFLREGLQRDALGRYVSMTREG